MINFSRPTPLFLTNNRILKIHSRGTPRSQGSPGSPGFYLALYKVLSMTFP